MILVMKSRFFAFGCSLTNYIWPTWADIVGANFDEFFNFGRGGASNFYILSKLLEADQQFDLNPETDTVIVMTTGINRYSFLEDDRTWCTEGDVSENVPITPWNNDWAIYQSWVAITAMKTLLKEKNIKHLFLTGLNFDHYIETPTLFNIGQWSIDRLKQIKSICKTKSALYPLAVPRVGPQRITDGHPFPAEHLDFVTNTFPEYITEKSLERYNFLFDGFDTLPLAEYKEQLRQKLLR